jgi:hypothetical protein
VAGLGHRIRFLVASGSEIKRGDSKKVPSCLAAISAAQTEAEQHCCEIFYKNQEHFIAAACSCGRSLGDTTTGRRSEKMKHLIRTTALVATMATAAGASTMVQDIDVTADVSALENRDAVSVWGALETDL